MRNEKGQFEKGFGGREKGTPNKVTKELRTILRAFVSKELDGIEKRVETLTDKERLEFLLKVLPFVAPKFKQEVMQSDKHFKYMNEVEL